MKLSKKLMLLSVIPTILFVLISCFYIIPKTKENIYLQKDIQIKNNVEIAHSTVEYYYTLSKSGVMADQEAQERAKEVISKMRYGSDGYFWIDNDQYINLMHATKPETVGQNRSNTQDAKGNYMVKNYIEGALQHKDSGYYSSFWFPKPNETEASMKRGYVKLFQPWGWIICSGVYIDDVEKAIAGEINGIIMINVLLMFISLVFAYLFSRKTIVAPLQNIIEKIREIANSGGDLTQRIQVSSKDELGELAGTVNDMTQNLAQLIRQVALTTEQVSASSEELTASASQSSEVANQIAAVLTEVAAAADQQYSTTNHVVEIVENMSQSVQQAVHNTKLAAERSEQTAKAAQEGVISIKATIGQMNDIERTVINSAGLVDKLGDRSKEIGQIVSTIANIANQTNLLALNAAIEAARAGEHGKGFAVVAEEVRKLAEQSETASEQIRQLISEIQQDTEKAVHAMDEGTLAVKQGTENINATGDTFGEIATLVNHVTDEIQRTVAAIHDIAEGAKQVASSMEVLDGVSDKTASKTQTVSASTEEQTASIEEIAIASDALSQLAEKLQLEIVKFKV
ncbi:MAG: chemotaxis sensory transducer [Firmicutes bacterium]|nr:chemotaxis sensory transducer [Bacillota bacterium]